MSGAAQAKPRVSVVMVNYNGGDLVLEAAQRCLGSSVPVALRIADNGSTDGSLERLRALAEGEPRLQLTEHGRNLGFAAACNPELAAAEGEYLLLLNPDSLLEADTLECMLAVFEQYPRVGMAGCRIINPDGTEQRGCRRTLPTLGSGFGRAFRLEGLRSRLNPAARVYDLNRQPLPTGPIRVEAISGAFMLLRRTALDEVGLLDTGYFLHCEDLDWCKRFAQQGWQILFVPQVEIVHHQGTCSTARPVRVEWHKHQGMVRYYRKFLAADHAFWVRWLVWLGIWTHLGLVALQTWTRRVSHGNQR